MGRGGFGARKLRKKFESCVQLWICACIVILTAPYTVWNYPDPSNSSQKAELSKASLLNTLAMSDSRSNECTKLGFSSSAPTANAYQLTSRTTRYENMMGAPGHYPYKYCKHSPGLASSRPDLRRTAVLSIFDSAYRDVIPAWLATVRHAGLPCFALCLDADVGATIHNQGCECVSAVHINGIPTKSTANVKGWHSTRVTAVRERFHAAAKLIDAGFDVIMHDADVFFASESLSYFMEYINDARLAVPGLELITQDNGIRKVPYDRLNWGFTWIKGVERNRNILRCTLQRWDDDVFKCSQRNCDASYHVRSQPRINRVVEETLHKHDDEHVCLIKSVSMKRINITHMTGYTNAATKQTCARARGYLSNPEVDSLAYNVPPESSPQEQKHALLTALNIAHVLDRKLEIPSAFHQAKKVDFCLLFDIHHVRSSKLSATEHSACTPTTLLVDILTSPQRLNTRRLCVAFAELARNLSSFVKSDADSDKVHLCNPHNPAYQGLHICQRTDGKDEV